MSFNDFLVGLNFVAKRKDEFDKVVFIFCCRSPGMDGRDQTSGEGRVDSRLNNQLSIGFK